MNEKLYFTVLGDFNLECKPHTKTWMSTSLIPHMHALSTLKLINIFLFC